MGLVKELFGGIEGIQIFGIISTILFIIAFLMMLIHTFSLKKEEVAEIKEMPLEEDQDMLNSNEK